MTTQLTIIIVAILLLGTIIFVTKLFVEKDVKSRAIDNGKTVKGIVLPLRLQAYERMALFLERIEPNQLIMRIHNPNLTVAQEQSLLLTAVRSEFEHNISQQIYISNDVWNRICNAKEDILMMISEVAEQVGANENSTPYAEALLTVSVERPVINDALNALKADVQRLF